MRLYKYGSVLPLIFGHSHYLDLSLEIVHVVIAYRSCNSLYFLVEKFVNILTKKNYYDQSNFGSMLWRRQREKVIHIARGENVVFYRWICGKNIATIWNTYQKSICTVHHRFYFIF
jgi:hypothetical protein